MEYTFTIPEAIFEYWPIVAPILSAYGAGTWMVRKLYFGKDADRHFWAGLVWALSPITVPVVGLGFGLHKIGEYLKRESTTKEK